MSTELTTETRNTEACNSTSVTVKPVYTAEQVDDSWKVNVEVPGVKKGDADLVFEDGILEIKATRTDSVPENWRPLSFSNRPDTYRLRLQLPETVAVDEIAAHLENGILQIDLPVHEEVKARAIEVK